MLQQIGKLFVCALFIGLVSLTAFSQNLADPEFKGDVANPAYSKNTPRVMFDESHNNSHTLTGKYKPFADLLMNDGFRFVVNRQTLTKKLLDSFKLLVIANALGNDIDEDDADKPAFTDEECTTVRDWVKSGGALLLIAGPGPFAKSAANLAKQFGIEMGASVIEDPAHAAQEFRSSVIVYSKDNHQLLDHPIVAGRDKQEQLNKVIVFSGQSLKGPADSVGFLKLADTARTVNVESASGSRGTSQGLALKVGSGRVVVFAEADMLSALLGDPPERDPIGMNYPGIDNKQLTLNVMHWLAGILK